MELYIDGRQAETDRDTSVSITLMLSSVTDPGTTRAGYSKSITIPMTPLNSEIMGHCEEIHGRDMFNDTLHTARVEADGCVVMEGAVHMTECRHGAMGDGYYKFNIIGAGMAWARHAAANRLNTLFPDFATVINAQTIQQSWTWERHVRFLPVQREAYEPENGEASLVPPLRVLTAADYHPFINVADVVREIFAEAGYEIVSDFAGGSFFRSLYMSGNYRAKDVSALISRMDFRAERFAPGSAVANRLGRVFADPNVNYSTVGNIVDTADPTETKNGVTLPDVYDKGGCFRKIGVRVAFVPTAAVSAGFRYHLKYTTSYRIVDAARLAGFDSVYLGNGELQQFVLTNRFADRRTEFRANKQFRCIISDYTEGKRYRLNAKRDGVNVVLGTFAARSAIVSATTDGVYTDLWVQWADSPSGAFTAYGGEWMLYDGYVGETGLTDVEVTLTSAAEDITPGAPKYFDEIYFGGADQEMQFTLTSAVVTPVFQAHPTVGAEVSFADVAMHDVSRLDVLNAVKHMFNLCFYTDNVAKTVHIEPRGDFNGDQVVDWSDRLVMSEPVSVSELGEDVAREVVFRYKSGDEAVARLNLAEGGHMGAWSARVNNLYAQDTVRAYENPLFTPTLNVAGCLPLAMSALLPNVGCRYTAAGGENLNFPAKIVRYAGLAALPAGERWGWPSNGAEYPLAAFHYPVAGGFTLCFEDRDGMQGLHRYWDVNLRTYNSGRRLTAYVRLWAADVEAIMNPNSLGRDFRARFRLCVDGEPGYWRLEEVCDYDPARAYAKCVFVKD